MREITCEAEFPAIQELLALAMASDRVMKELQDYLHKPERNLYVMEQREGVAVGCIGIERMGSRRGEIRHIAVSPQKRCQQVGSDMIAEVQHLHGFLQLHAETDSDAVGFYRSCGFNISSLGEKYPGVERFLCVKRWQMGAAARSPVI